jgi:hypothetical protein
MRLWRQVTDQAFSDRLAIDALEQIAQRGTEAVRNITMRALKDIHHFQGANIAE